LPEVGRLSGEDISPGQAFDTLIEQAAAPFGVLGSCERLQPFSHGFTHFKLHVVPYRARLARRLDRVGEGTHVWLKTDRLAGAALPAPVKKLLLALFGEADLLSD
jgi:A/G-specific adenine glycosylase